LRLLILTSRFPYPIEKGDKLRAFHQIRTMAKRHEIVLVALTERPVPAEDLARLTPLCRRVEVIDRPRRRILPSLVEAAVAGRPVQVGYFDDAPSAARLAEVVAEERPDAVFAQLIRTAPMVRGLGVPVVLDYQDAFSAITRRRSGSAPLPLRPLLRLEAARIGRYEASVADWVDATTIISEADRQLLRLTEPGAVTVVPNGVDTDYFAPPAVRPDTRHDLVFVGNLGYRPNVEAAHFLVEQVLPLLRLRRRGARLLLAGARPSRSVRRLAGDGVELSGWMDDIRDAYLSAPVMVAPLFGGAGQQNKILEAMAMGTPCVTSERVNAAIGASEREIVVAGDARSFADATADLLEQPRRAGELAVAARRFVEERYAWDEVVGVLEGVLEQTARMADQ
jgi:polysaccharide biosynthesis protein PslH